MLRELALAVAASCIASSAGAAVVNSVTRAEFAAAVNGVTIKSQNFDSFVDGALLIGPQDGVTFAASKGTVIVTNQFLSSTGENGVGSTATEADNQGQRFFTSDNQVTITFDNPIVAFAIDINTVARTSAAFQAAILSGDTILSVFDPFPGFATGQFIGIITDTPFTSLVISALIDENFTLDTLVYRVTDANGVVPLPGAFLLMLGGLAALGAGAKRNTAA